MFDLSRGSQRGHGRVDALQRVRRQLPLHLPGGLEAAGCSPTSELPALSQTVHRAGAINPPIGLSRGCAGAFQLYNNWLYYRTISVESSQEGLQGWSDRIALSIDAYLLGAEVDDQAFCYALLQFVISECVQAPCCPGGDLITMAYTETNGPCSLRTLLVGLYLNARLERNTFDHVWRHVPAEFKSDLGAAFFTRDLHEVRIGTVESLSTRYLPPPPQNDG